MKKGCTSEGRKRHVTNNIYKVDREMFNIVCKPEDALIYLYHISFK